MVRTADEMRRAGEAIGERLWRSTPAPAAMLATAAALALAGCSRGADKPAAAQKSTATANPDGAPGQPAATPGGSVGPANSLAAPSSRSNGSASGNSIGGGPSTNDHRGTGGPG